MVIYLKSGANDFKVVYELPEKKTLLLLIYTVCHKKGASIFLQPAEVDAVLLCRTVKKSMDFDAIFTVSLENN